jgi:heme/copper-type cytochrome/quinol oxidase subunit 2
MEYKYHKLRIKILYAFIFFILLIKFIYFILFIINKYLVIYYKFEKKDNQENNEKFKEKISYYKLLTENVFIVSSSILLAYLFYPYHTNDLLNNFINNKYGKFLIFVYSFVILITFDWQSFKPGAV